MSRAPHLVTRCRRAARWLLRVRTRDATRLASAGSAIVIAPHPDDDVLGCGTTILRKRDRGERVLIVIVSDGSDCARPSDISATEVASVRREEATRCAELLGGSDIVFLDFVDGTLSEHVAGIANALSDLVATYDPVHVFAPRLDDVHADHIAVARAALVATATHACALWQYPVWGWRRWPLTGNSRGLRRGAEAICEVFFRQTVRVASAGYGERKIAAFRAHETQAAGREGWQTLPADLLEILFGRHEFFFPFTGARGKPSRP